MTAHMCTTLTDGCYRCELNRDEMAAIEAEIREEAQAAWVEYRDTALRNGWVRTALRRRDFIAGYVAREHA